VGENGVRPVAFELLGRLLGVRTIASTGGGQLGGRCNGPTWSMRSTWDVLPIAIGGRGTPALFDAALGPHEAPTHLDLLSAPRRWRPAC
jgi:hypothetical protein